MGNDPKSKGIVSEMERYLELMSAEAMGLSESNRS
jgi:hypothetical protein